MKAPLDPAAGGMALLLVDVVNHFAFPGGEELLRESLAIAPNIAALKKRARNSSVPVIYVNDNFGDWRADLETLTRECLEQPNGAAEFVRQLQPAVTDFRVLKPMHSGFYSTPLEILLRRLSVETVLVAGIATPGCVLSTVQDANMRRYKVLVPEDCCAARVQEEHLAAIRVMRTIQNAQVGPAKEFDFPSK